MYEVVYPHYSTNIFNPLIKTFKIYWTYHKKLRFEYTLFIINNTIISHMRLELAKNKTNAKQHPEAELFLFENYLHS